MRFLMLFHFISFHYFCVVVSLLSNLRRGAGLGARGKAVAGLFFHSFLRRLPQSVVLIIPRSRLFVLALRSRKHQAAFVHDRLMEAPASDSKHLILLSCTVRMAILYDIQKNPEGNLHYAEGKSDVIRSRLVRLLQ